MKRKVAAVLVTAIMLATPTFAATVVSSPNTPAAQAVIPAGAKKQSVHATSLHAHKAHHAKHAKPNQTKHARKISKKNPTSANTKNHTKAVAAAPTKAPVKN
jgi:hypothetical protein